MKFTALSLLLLLPQVLVAASYEYKLEAREIAKDTWLLEGKNENFTKHNGGNIANIVFITTKEGVLLIDTGPSLRFGNELIELIKSKTDKPIVRVLNTHHHPDHFLGNQAFKDQNIQSLRKTGELIAIEGDAFATNLYTLVGDWMRGTQVHLPDAPLEPEPLTLGSHKFSFHTFTGHSGSDLVVLDQSTGVLFASDMVFYQRALTTPHTPGINVWLEDLEKLKQLDFSILVPGHGPVSMGSVAIDQTADYLVWLDKTLEKAADQGLAMNETMKLPIDKRFTSLAEVGNEYSRSVVHLYPDYEERFFGN